MPLSSAGFDPPCCLRLVRLGSVSVPRKGSCQDTYLEFLKSWTIFADAFLTLSSADRFLSKSLTMRYTKCAISRVGCMLRYSLINSVGFSRNFAVMESQSEIRACSPKERMILIQLSAICFGKGGMVNRPRCQRYQGLHH